MNSHYWRACAMLVRCLNCSQVIEVSTLTNHLLSECEQHKSYEQCGTCRRAVRMSEKNNHDKKCIDVPEGHQQCPLCKKNLEEEDNMWKVHLMGESPCVKNTRVKYVKQVKIKL